MLKLICMSHLIEPVHDNDQLRLAHDMTLHRALRCVKLATRDNI